MFFTHLKSAPTVQHMSFHYLKTNTEIGEPKDSDATIKCNKFYFFYFFYFF